MCSLITAEGGFGIYYDKRKNCIIISLPQSALEKDISDDEAALILLSVVQIFKNKEKP